MTQDELKEMTRTIRTIAVYMERKDESPLCARDLFKIAENLELLWSDNIRLQAENARLREAATQALREMNDFGNKLNWPAYMPMSYAEAINNLRAALA